MRNSFLIILIALIVVGGASYTFVRNKEQRNAELEKLVRKDEAKAKTAEAKKKTAEAEARKAKESAAEAKSKAEAAKDERQARLAAEAEAKELAKAKEAEARKAEADAKTASENARKAEAELKTAEAKKAEAAFLVQHAETTNAVRQAELQTALAATHLVELDLQRILATSNTLALQKADYATKLVEVEKLQEELRRREEETRPNKTLLQLMEEEEKALQAELDTAFGILICGTGIGMSMCANKHRGIRAALCSDTFSARMTRVHNNANVLCMGARVIGSCLASDIMNAFLAAEFEDGGRHRQRVDMMMEIEKNQ